ncbi:MAG: CoA pyrophosphatase, partial [Acetobacteraceae bacterium]|nr:CoA pyrophosphatase [Acetobacteraceae bacterium]
ARLVREEQPGKLVRGSELLAALTGPPVPAAVLVAFVMRQKPALLLTRRNERLKRHAGQVSFPGGRIDPVDVDATAAALREAEEEIGLVPTQVEVLGRLGDFLTGTGFRITPVLGLIPPDLPLRPDPHEVDAVFEFPIETLLDPDAPRRERQERRGIVRDVWIWPHPKHYIWGATAAIMVHLAERLRDGE